GLCAGSGIVVLRISQQIVQLVSEPPSFRPVSGSEPPPDPNANLTRGFVAPRGMPEDYRVTRTPLSLAQTSRITTFIQFSLRCSCVVPEMYSSGSQAVKNNRHNVGTTCRKFGRLPEISAAATLGGKDGVLPISTAHRRDVRCRRRRDGRTPT